MKIAVLVALLLGISAAFAGDIYNPGANSIGDYPDIDNPQTTAPASTGSALLVNGIDAALLVNGTDPACLAGGC